MYPFGVIDTSSVYFSNVGLVVFICSLILAAYSAKQKEWRTCMFLLLAGITGIAGFYVKEIVRLGS